MESTVYRVIMIIQQKVIVSLDRTLNDTLLQAVKGDISGIIIIQIQAESLCKDKDYQRNPSNSLGGAFGGSTSQTQHHIEDEQDISRTYLLRQRVWSQYHSRVLVLKCSEW